ncbi:MAG: hypothetical protein VYC10_07090, partial [Pseudomonadota bacterium]|nr:hypothetical protein [Pseudomonadota bacterium]
GKGRSRFGRPAPSDAAAVPAAPSEGDSSVGEVSSKGSAASRSSEGSAAASSSSESIIER